MELNESPADQSDLASSIEMADDSDGDSSANESDTNESNNALNDAFGCNHYKRRCKLKAVCCSQLHWCRFCHDENNNHEMDRHAVQEVQCGDCEILQVVSNKCTGCAVVFGDYFCPVCRLYDVDKGQFHCEKCGICRVGPKNKYFHCDTCNACLHNDLRDKHKCVENMSMSVCPICQEYLHTSRQSMNVPRCGHMIHQECLTSCFDQGIYQCPMCKESLVDMQPVWKEMDAACASVVLPDDLKNVRLNILCCDCHKECEVGFNTEGLKCRHCGSYNTAQS